MWGPFLTAVLGLVSFYFVYNIYNILNYDIRPDIPNDFCWGKEENCKNDTNVYPFVIDIKKEEIQDLISNLENVRQFIPALEKTQTQYGINGDVLKTVVKFVREEYNFTERQIYLNKYPQFITNIQGINIHFLHIKSKNEKKLPVIAVLLLHGWPSSVREFYDSIPLFTSEDRYYVIELVIPSVVGFGYSDGQSKPNFRSAHIANLMKILMERLGYQKFLVHGSDWGSLIASNIAILHPKQVLGLHSNFCFSFRVITFIKLFLGGLYPPAVIEKKYEDKLYPLYRYIRFLFYESAYLHFMGTKPDTIGHMLDNSPTGLISFILEKLSVGTNKDNIYSKTAGLEKLDLTSVMDTIFFYFWFPRKATTASRIYAENLSIKGLLEGMLNVPIDPSVPCACTLLEHEFLYMPENFLRDKYKNLVRTKTYQGVGHFAALEANDVLTKDILLFVDLLSGSKLTSSENN